jgi:hypothetical protein
MVLTSQLPPRSASRGGRDTSSLRMLIGVGWTLRVILLTLLLMAGLSVEPSKVVLAIVVYNFKQTLVRAVDVFEF